VAEGIGGRVPGVIGGGGDQDDLEPGILGEEARGDVQRVLGLLGQIQHRDRGVGPDAAQPAELVQPVGAEVGEPHLERSGLRRRRGMAQLLGLQRVVARTAGDEHLQDLEEVALFGAEEDDAGVHVVLHLQRPIRFKLS
jgi:hypothetical protein